MLWLYLHFPSLQLDSMFKEIEEPNLPLILVHGKKNEVIQLNDAAMKEGIKLGMGLGSAASLCHKLQVKPYDEKIESQMLKRIARWLYPASADITLFQPNGLLLRVSSMLTFHKNLDNYWQVISRRLNHLSMQYQYATGYTPLVARLLARQGLNQISNDKRWMLQHVKKQPLACSDLSFKDIKRLNKTGIRTLDHLLTLSLVDLSKRFDVEVVNYIGKLTGYIQHHVNFYIPPSGFEHYLELYYEISNHLYLEKPLLKLFLLLETYLKHKDILAVEVELILHQRDTDDLNLLITAAQGEYKSDKWWHLSQLSLESIKLAAPVVAITLKANRLLNKYAQDFDLFKGSQGSQSPEELTAVLAAKLGSNRVRGVCVTADARPEVANQLCQPFTRSNLHNNLPPNNKLRPSILLPVPQPLNEQVTLMPYPERIVTGWWDNNKAVRDYFLGRTQQGQWLWLFRDHNLRWYVHGVFS